MTTTFCVLVATEVVVIGPGVLLGTAQVSSRLRQTGLTSLREI